MGWGEAMRVRVEPWLLGLLPMLAAGAVLLSTGQLDGTALAEALAAGGGVWLCLAIVAQRRLRRVGARLGSLAQRLSKAVGAVSPVSEWTDPHAGAAALEPLVHSACRALADAEKQHQQAEAIFAHMADGIVVVDGELRIQRLNPAAAEMLSLSPERTPGRTVIEATMHHGLDTLFRQALSTGEAQETRLEVIQPRRRLLRALVSPLRGPNTGAGAVAVIQDLTDFGRIERVRRDFVSNVSHELRTPVSSIKVMAESLQRGALEQPELASQFLRSITEAADRLSTLIDDLLALARAEAGAGRHAWQRVDLAAMAHQALSDLQPLAREFEISLTAEAVEPTVVMGDAEGLRQAITNLVTNGIRYNRPGGQVSLRLRRTPEGVRLEVTDTGIGIASEHLPRIFERFYRVDRGRSRGSGGTGLGLAIVKHVAEAHGGQVTVESAPGRGSTFTLTLPERALDPG